MADDYGSTAKLNGTYLPGFDADAALEVFPEAVVQRTAAQKLSGGINIAITECVSKAVATQFRRWVLMMFAGSAHLHRERDG